MKILGENGSHWKTGLWMSGKEGGPLLTLWEVEDWPGGTGSHFQLPISTL